MPSTRRARRTAMLSQRRDLRYFTQYSSCLALQQRSRVVIVISAVPSMHRAWRLAMLFTMPWPAVLRPVLVGLSIAAALSRCRCRECQAQYASGLACSDAFTMPQPDVPMFPSPNVAVLYPVRVGYNRWVSAILRELDSRLSHSVVSGHRPALR